MDPEDSRFQVGKPRSSDSSLLFLLDVIAKMKPARAGGSRAVFFSHGSPLSTGGPGSGEDAIRRHIFEEDLLESLIILPEGLLDHTGIQPFVWVLDSNKPIDLRQKVRIINASTFGHSVRNRSSSKVKMVETSDIRTLEELLSSETHSRNIKEFHFGDFKYHQLKVVRPKNGRGHRERLWGYIDAKTAAASLREKYGNVDVDPASAENPLINPSPEVQANLKSWAALTDEQTLEFNTLYAAVTGG